MKLFKNKTPSDEFCLTCVEGLFGAGKTAEMVSMMAAHVAKGGVVATNVNIKIDPYISPKYGPQGGFRYALKKKYGWDLKEGQIIRLSDQVYITIQDRKGKDREVPQTVKFWENIPKGTQDMWVMVCIDEAHKTWGKYAYEYMPANVEEVVSIFRHLCLDVYVASQSWNKVWIGIREITQAYIKLNNLKNGGLGITASLPPLFRVVVSLPLDLITLLMRPFTGFLPDVIRVRKFRGEAETKKNLIKGYPKFKRHDPLILGSYDSPDSAGKVKMSNDLPNDFREDSSGQNKEEKKAAFKKYSTAAFGFLIIVYCLAKAFGGNSDQVGDSKPAKKKRGLSGFICPSSVRVNSVEKPASFSSPSSVVLPSVSSGGVLYYVTKVKTNFSSFIQLENGVRLYVGDEWGGLKITKIDQRKIFYSDGSFNYLARVKIFEPPPSTSADYSVSAGGSGSDVVL